MRIIFAGSELTPLARTGGLGDVIEALPPALAAHGHEVTVILPCYRGLREDKALKAVSTGVKLTVPLRDQQHTAEILQCTGPNGIQIFLVRHDDFFDRAGLYGTEGRGFDDNSVRYIFFSKIVVELARRISPPPDILHVHDWQTALVPVLVKDRRLPFRTVLTVHNLAYQGSFWSYDFGLTNLPNHYFGARGVEFYGQLNLLKGGVLYADQVTTVSERYALEIQTPEFGAGLDAVIRENLKKVSGILNGADYRIWDPAQDKLLPKTYTVDDVSGKVVCRDALLKEVGLTPAPTGPVIAIVTRLATQKGIDLLIPLLEKMLSHDIRLVILGEGEPQYERELTVVSRRWPERFAFRQTMDEPLAHLIYAGADIFLIPSHYEPCGLSAMYALKYGALPIAHATGGLFEMIQDYDPSAGTGNGVLFHHDSAEAFWDAIVRTLGYFEDQAEWAKLRRRAMTCDYSWDRAVPRYEAIYERALKG